MRTTLYFLFLFVSLAATATAQTNTFTYQGRLIDNNVAAGGSYEMQFRVFDSADGGLQQPQPTPVTLTFSVAGSNPVSVLNGAFTVQLNFGGGIFTGASRWLEISVRKPSDPPGYTLLNPRQPLTSSPYSIKAINANAADMVTSACVLCITDAQISSIDGGKVSGTVANAANATTATNVSGIVPIVNGGTGSSTKNFVDLSTNQTSIGGNKTFTGTLTGNGSGLTNLNGANLTARSITTDKLAPVFGYFSNTFVAAPVLPGGSVPFANAGPVSGIVSSGGGTNFTLPDTGVYEVAWQVSVEEAGALALTLNGIQQSTTVVGRSTGTTQIVGDVLINANAGDVLSVRAAAVNSNVLSIAILAGGGDPLTCSLVIKRIK